MRPQTAAIIVFAALCAGFWLTPKLLAQASAPACDQYDPPTCEGTVMNPPGFQPAPEPTQMYEMSSMVEQGGPQGLNVAEEAGGDAVIAAQQVQKNEESAEAEGVAEAAEGTPRPKPQPTSQPAPEAAPQPSNGSASGSRAGTGSAASDPAAEEEVAAAVGGEARVAEVGGQSVAPGSAPPASAGPVEITVLPDSGGVPFEGKVSRP